MKNKFIMIIFVVVCCLICVIPFAGMTVARTDRTTENKTLAKWPNMVNKGKWNTNYLQEMGEYFEDHFAFKNQLVAIDSSIQSKVFGVSNMDTVIVGNSGWLYYKDTLDDYLGQNTSSNRKLHNIVNNISILQKYVESKGVEFVLTIAPNKNSLYGENMPYYYQKKVSDTNNMTLLNPIIKEYGIAYADLYDAFKNQEEVLYLKRDSHWNGKGAVLAYNTILDAAGIDHENYETTKSIRTKDEYGDLSKMIYPMGDEPEWNYTYQYESNFVYETNTKSVEDAWIETSNSKGKGTLLMFRDSFGNTLLPLMAETFNKAYFSKSVPYQIETYINEYNPDMVVVEKVERNIENFAVEPPVMTGPKVKEDIKAEELVTEATIKVRECEYDSSFWQIYGNVDDEFGEEEINVYVKITVNKEASIYEAFTVSDQESDNGYLLYMPKEILESESVNIEIITEEDGEFYSVKKKVIDIN